MSYAAFVALWGLLILLGRGLTRRLPTPKGIFSYLLVWTLAGVFGLHAALTLLDALGAGWTLGTVGLVAAVGLALNFIPGGPGVSGRNWKGRWSWGLTLAVAGALALAGVVTALWATNPDFIYHWGIKGHRFFLTGGIDETFLLQPWNRLSHPDYPFLQPQLFVVTALLRGFFDEPAMLLQGALWCFLTAVAARQALSAAGAGRWTVECTTAAVGLSLAMFAIAHRLSGGPDLLLSWVLVAAAAPLLTEPPKLEGGRAGITAMDVQLALAAAVGGAAKLEGVPLGAAVLLAYGLRRRLWQRPWPIRRLILLAAPMTLAVLPWWMQIRSLEVAGRLNEGPFDWGHWPAIAPELLRSVTHPHWNGLVLLLALTLPLAALNRRVRPLLVVALAQLLLYIYVYFTALEAPQVHVRTSFTRVLCHVVPALLVAVALALDGWAQKAPVSARPQTLP